MDKKIPHPKTGQIQQLQDNTAQGQRKRLMQRLRQGPVTTTEARESLDILMPAARIHELRWQRGFNILTHYREVETVPGRKHTVAEYVLMPGKWQGVVA